MNIENYKAIADSIALLLFPHAEVIVHEVKSQTVVHIANNFSKRALGDDSALDLELGDFRNAAKLGPYEKLNWDGQKIRSITTVLYNPNGEAEHLLCINLNFSVLEQAREALDAFFQISRLVPQPDALFKDDWQERINTFLHAWLQARNLSLRTLKMKEKRALVEALHAEGAFEGRSGADYVANVLNMGRATVYKYLKELRDQPV
ncbi:PAS domain-containing protein [Pseudomonas sp. P39-UII1]|uniref:helix-turn-helix transcriptional regulator n=1 Tax=Pseudomonas sp. P39-UII1 TaxID=3080333 RepID=UPI00320AA525